MTFMLNYAWRRQSATTDGIANGNQSPTPLAVQASDDTTVPEQEADENCIPQREEPPTPEGLRPRQPLQRIREELDIPQHVMQQREQHLPIWPPMACLPPRTSPQVTHSSFYSRDSSGMVAESPDLGQARTAVGALVAITQGVLPKASEKNNISNGRLGMLPPRTWKEAEDVDEDEDISYQRLHDSMDVWSPDRTPKSFRAAGSPQSTTQSSIHPSPSTKAWTEWQQREEEQRNVSFSSREALVPGREEMERPSYNFDSIAPEESRQEMHGGPSYVVATDADMANVSVLSQSSAPINSHHRYEQSNHYATDNESIHSLDSVQNSYLSQSRFNNAAHQEEAMENVLMNRKMKNQRQAKEQMVMGAVQRLQHNLDLVSAVDALHEEDEQWFVKTPMDKEGLLTGFSKSNRKELRKYVQSILNEMQVARPEDFILSPSQAADMADTHDDLHDALVFLDGILQIAVPLSEQNPGERWACKRDIQSTMGIASIPESPETVRGGDTSLFSLPSESATPCTSNVSLATTITSKPSPHRRKQAQSTSSEEAGHIRRTIEIVSTLMQKMTNACHEIFNRKSSQDAIRATEEVKRNYLQLMTMKNQDIRSVVDAFIVGVSDMPLTRAVSVEEDQACLREQPIVTMPLQQAASKPTAQMQYVLNNMGPASQWQDMFSPCTDDMKSVRIEPDEECEEDDLRRTMGSNDYNEEFEERDAPEEERSNDSDQSVSLQNMVFYSWGAAEMMTTPNPLQK